jgi:hypothetical protein
MKQKIDINDKKQINEKFNDIGKVKDKAIPVNRPWKPVGLWDVEGQSTHRWL